MKHEPVFQSFLESSMDEALLINRESDLVNILPVPPFPASRYLCAFRCDSLAGNPASGLRNPEFIVLEIYFGPNHLRELRTGEVVTLIEPLDLFHSNVRAPFVCVGDMVPGAPLMDIVIQLFEIFTYNNVTLTEGLNREAADWARQRLGEFPLDRRPIFRAKSQIRKEEA